MRQGQATLSFVLLVGGILALIGVTIAFFYLSFLNSVYGFRAANQALAAAQGGVRDALLQLLRNKDFSAPSGYSVPLGTMSVNVTVTQNTPIAGNATITSSATVSKSKRTFQVIVSIATSTGEMNIISWQPI